jgi:flavin reductase (DIM6/NTAB) family NADH-FMN oxidoreductase RutF
MDFDLSQLPQRAAYNLLIGLVTPRPIALITSFDREGRVNAAPFSAYNYLGTDPAIVAIGVANRPAPRDFFQLERQRYEDRQKKESKGR